MTFKNSGGPSREDGLLDEIREITNERDEAQWRAQEIDTLWREKIAAAVREGVSVAHIAVVAGISAARVYQIRDGRR